MANIGSQDFVIRYYNGVYAISLSIVTGTVVGLIVKYILDKKFIFQYRIKNIAHDTRIFTLYTSTGIITTAVFWGFEFGFEYAFHTKELRYLGGIIGLAIGYLLKYHLDKHFVFLKEST